MTLPDKQITRALPGLLFILYNPGLAGVFYVFTIDLYTNINNKNTYSGFVGSKLYVFRFFIYTKGYEFLYLSLIECRVISSLNATISIPG
jgi:hypothetical protein